MGRLTNSPCSPTTSSTRSRTCPGCSGCSWDLRPSPGAQIVDAFLQLITGGRRDGGTAAYPAQLVVNPAVWLAGAVMRGRHQGVEFLAQIAQLPVGGPGADAAVPQPLAVRMASCSSCRRRSRSRIWSASSRPGMPR